jgi:hypothetical protein
MAALVTRDRLLLAFADLGSYGIVAQPSVSGPITRARAFMEAKAAHRAPFAQRDHVFWREADDAAAFDAAGNLTGALMLHIGNPELAAAVETCLHKAGVSGARRASSLQGITLLPPETTKPRP